MTLLRADTLTHLPPKNWNFWSSVSLLDWHTDILILWREVCQCVSLEKCHSWKGLVSVGHTLGGWCNIDLTLYLKLGKLYDWEYVRVSVKKEDSVSKFFILNKEVCQCVSLEKCHSWKGLVSVGYSVWGGLDFQLKTLKTLLLGVCQFVSQEGRPCCKIFHSSEGSVSVCQPREVS